MSSVDVNKAIIAGLEFSVAKEGTCLYGKYTASAGGKSVDMSQLRRAVQLQEFADACIDENNLRALFQAIRNRADWAEGLLAEKRDAAAEVQISQDELTATLVLTAPYGGNPVTRDLISRALLDAGVVAGIKKQAIRELFEKAVLLDKGATVQDIVAEGCKPVAGKDTWFERIFHDEPETRPVQSENGTVDYRQFSTIRTVPAGIPLMRKYPPTPGEAGHTVNGKIVPPEKGQSLDFQCGDGVAVSKENPDLLVSAVAGVPNFYANGARINRVIEVENVDLSTGNIDIDSNLIVTGDILSGMSVKVTGDVRVKGTVESAHIQAGGSVRLSGGIIGGSRSNEEKKCQAFVQCGGDFSARFVEHAHLQVDGSVTVAEVIAHSYVKCKTQVLVGVPSGRGLIVGGSVSSAYLIDAKVLGSSAFVATHVEVGFDESVKLRLEALLSQINNNNITLTELARAIVQYEQKPNPQDEKLPTRLRETEKQLKSDQSRLEQLKLDLYEELTTQHNVKIICRKQAFPAVNVNIANLCYEVKDEHPTGVFDLRKEHVHFEHGVK